MSPYNYEFRQYPSREELTTALCGRISELLTAAVARRGTATLAVSGGSTPVPLFEALAVSDLPWADIHITLVDERWVPPDHPDSNELLVWSYLLCHKASAAPFTGLYTGGPDARRQEKYTAHCLAALPWPADVLILGMGGDGHTASLFPGAPELAAATDMDSGRLCLAVTPPAAPHQRMSLTLPAIVASRHLLLHLTGPDKEEVFQQAVTHDGDYDAMPIRHVLARARQPVEVHWSR